MIFRILELRFIYETFFIHLVKLAYKIQIFKILFGFI